MVTRFITNLYIDGMNMSIVQYHAALYIVSNIPHYKIIKLNNNCERVPK